MFTSSGCSSAGSTLYIRISSTGRPKSDPKSKVRLQMGLCLSLWHCTSGQEPSIVPRSRAKHSFCSCDCPPVRNSTLSQPDVINATCHEMEPVVSGRGREECACGSPWLVVVQDSAPINQIQAQQDNPLQIPAGNLWIISPV